MRSLCSKINKCAKCKTKRRLTQNKDFLLNLANDYSRHKKYRKKHKFYEKINDSQLKCLCEIILNLCLGNIPVSNDALRNFKLHHCGLRMLYAKTVPVDEKRKILKQSGKGFIIPLLISSVLPAIIEFMFSEIKH